MVASRRTASETVFSQLLNTTLSEYGQSCEDNPCEFSTRVAVSREKQSIYERRRLKRYSKTTIIDRIIVLFIHGLQIMGISSSCIIDLPIEYFNKYSILLFVIQTNVGQAWCLAGKGKVPAGKCSMPSNNCIIRNFRFF